MCASDQPGRRFLFHDIFKGENEPIHYRVAWTDDEPINFLVTPGKIREILDGPGYSIQNREDKKRASLE